MIDFILFLFFALGAAAFGLCLLLSLALGRNSQNPARHRRIKRSALSFATFFALAAVWVLFSQWTASTPQIRDESGEIPGNSIARLEQVELNGRQQWISIRGHDKTKPVLLFLAGGPGGTQMAAARHTLPELERHFVVVNWDQPGAGKSYGAAKGSALTPDMYIADGYALTQYLQKTFQQEKIYLVGESWGSALSVFLASRHPEAYRGLIGIAQMVDFAETERLDYQKALELAKAAGDEKTVVKLEKNGEPPYYGKSVSWKSAVYINKLNEAMFANPEIRNPGYETLRDIFSSEYGVLDQINYVRGILFTFNDVYQQLYETDLREAYPSLEVPVYFFLGVHDLNAPLSLAEDYCSLLKAPKKEIVWFYHSGHSPWIQETERFVEELLRCFPVAESTV